MTSSALIDVAGLSVAFAHTTVVHSISLQLHPGECIALVGESGSGKSVTARALLGLAGPRSTVHADRMVIAGSDRLNATEREWRSIRGSEIGLVLQDALVSLDPLRAIGREIGDAIRLHNKLSAAQTNQRVIELLERVGMPQPERAALRRSGELSGGLRQRALIAAALAANPPVLIADEPTTALDATVQARILALLADLKAQGTGLILISHDLAVVSQLADRIIVMRDGRAVEEGPSAQLLESPNSEYTRELIAAVPSAAPRAARDLSDQPAALEAVGLSKSYRVATGTVRAADEVSLRLHPGETLGLVGESGSGKSTVGRMLLGLEAPDAGTVSLDGDPWAPLPERSRRARRHRIGAIYQDSLSSFDPRWNVERIIRDALREPNNLATLLNQVGLSLEIASRHPSTLSGGQRQRVAIARALAADPDILICDEPVSALDVTVQAQVLELLTSLQEQRGLSMLFISHDLGVIRQLSDQVAVMKDGQIVEHGHAEHVLNTPTHEYTAQLLADAPRLEVRPGRSQVG